MRVHAQWHTVPLVDRLRDLQDVVAWLGGNALVSINVVTIYVGPG